MMKWRVERPIATITDAKGPLYITIGPDIVGANEVNHKEGCLWFSNPVAPGKTGFPEVVKIYAPGQWTTVERVEDE